ncbi:1-acyl-sn-glycerol-3-phosphate acyltransferase [Umezakia ovalisporum]|uniref:1-acyl-sn-glycerol-3-phosphate acyltransferase n=2 Tax=Umezakia ovalisporum TaxID=75695 RepID=A0AA43GZH4_9CYAN|nr:1-acyl-sn-glycerol-3-phosphate acyltransferase [Umezakia ovalisporum]MDH6058121.1 1-acyl-sn-glycerol-3-phosphate acyltransferase [Umezakia ovalisporum FSS-43]MDH6064268.1 1-acyl-sn-glycerol-3-phosphate acyltransferase [Umezakia ovalisporum FSS-62]MDH6066263.1 1-acyl-sn-glycerol-3-phosphate acyltransferase [Umezakia ovalisporum APH033B]MDH6071822.1 1-acyl-sn-glycerol-3-phosphate acyltransferase [Umezakia ovalisporum CobakiLakeA]MDH6073567.1 1-acyl-sn-glycerol-3-phosphate acyltransferase [Ume
MPKSIHSTQPPLKFIPQRFNPLILHIFRWLLPIVLRFRTRPWLPAGIVQVEAQNVEILAKLYQQFQSGNIRFLIAFRHPEVEDPLCMLYLLSHILPKVARQHKIKLQQPLHSYFLYDRGMTVWAGDWLGWLFSRVGGVPIRRGRRLDRQAIQRARELFSNGEMPIAVAPEGGNNGHSEIVSPLEPGVAQLGFWCVEDLQKAHRSEAVVIVPVGIQYSYIEQPWSKLNWLLTKLEADSGLEPVDQSGSNKQRDLYYQRICRLAEHFMTEMEEFYRRFYHQDIPKTISIHASARPNEILIARLHRLMDKALHVAEQYFAVQAQGNFIDRCRRLEEAGWNYIYRDDITNINTLSPFNRGLADWVASEADLNMQHMRLVESFVAVTANYIQEKPTAERFAETTLLMFDMLSRIQESTLPGRPRLGLRKAMITIGEPISVTERWKQSQGDRSATRQAMSQLTKDTYTALQSMIDNN